MPLKVPCLLLQDHGPPVAVRLFRLSLNSAVTVEILILSQSTVAIPGDTAAGLFSATSIENLTDPVSFDGLSVDDVPQE